MKRIFTLAVGILSAVALFAAERNPSVTLNTSSDYEVKIDGKYYFTQNSGNTINIPNMQQGRHSIEVYRVEKKLFGKNRTLVNSSSFDVRDRDLTIYVDNSGRIDVRETGYSTNGNDRNTKGDDGNVYDRDGKTINGNNSDRRSRGRGHKYGHNKEWKQEKMKNKEWKKEHDDDDDDIDNDDNDDDDDYDKAGKKAKQNKNKGKSKGNGKG